MGIIDKPVYRYKDLAAIFGVSPYTIQWRCDRGKYGILPKDRSGRRYFTPEDLQRIVSQERATNEFGLPIQPFYDAGDLARVLNLSYDRIRYLLDRGTLVAPPKLNRHHRFTPDEFRTLVSSYQAMALPKSRRQSALAEAISTEPGGMRHR